MGNQAPGLTSKCCTPVCCAMCLHEDTLKDSTAKDSTGDNSQANFANSASALGGSDAAAEEIALDDSLEKELAQEVELWRLESTGPADEGAVFGISSAPRSRGDAEVFKPEPAAAARWAGVGTSEPHPSASWPGVFQAEPGGASLEAPPPAGAAARPPPARRPPDSTARGGDRGAWTEAAAANLDARGSRNANRGATAAASRGEAPRMPHMPPPIHSALESGCDEVQSSSDEDGFAGFLEHGADFAPTTPAAKGSERSVF